MHSENNIEYQWVNENYNDNHPLHKSDFRDSLLFQEDCIDLPNMLPRSSIAKK